MLPLVSVIMPAYNGEKFIEESIKSIIAQTYCHWELIIVDDCSTDNTYNIIQTFKEKRIKIFQNKTNLGIAATTNRAIEQSNGKYIALLDDDDISMADRIELQVRYMEKNPEIAILGGGAFCINESGEFIGYFPEPRNNPNYIHAMLLFQNLDFANSTTMIRKDFIKENNLTYKNDCFGMQDYRFFVEASKLGRISAINNFLIEYRWHSDNETKKIKEIYKKEREKKYLDFQLYSLSESGFVLSKSQIQTISKFFSAYGGKCNTRKDVEALYDVLNDILKQAKKMNVEYYDELVHVCKTKFAKVLIKSDLFEKMCL